jgi:spectinomycin phosphotransferase
VPVVYTRPEAIADESIIDALRDGWAFDAWSVAYLPAGFGSHHWVAQDADETKRFVTVDDLTARDFLGSSPPEAFDALHRAFATAHALRESGLDWVVGPLVDRDGQVLRWLDETFSIAVFPYVDGAVSAEYASEAERTEVVALLAEVHRRTGQVAALARLETFAVPARTHLEAAMASLATPWTGGPYAEPARVLLGQHLEGVHGRLEEYDGLVAKTLSDPTGWTITHGEPQSSNVLRTRTGLLLIDWDTVLVAPPERDLWMVVDSPSDTAAVRYTSLTGRAVRPDLLRLYALWWDLCEISIYVSEFRAPHGDTEDAAEAWRSLQHFIADG